MITLLFAPPLSGPPLLGLRTPDSSSSSSLYKELSKFPLVFIYYGIDKNLLLLYNEAGPYEPAIPQLKGLFEALDRIDDISKVDS